MCTLSTNTHTHTHTHTHIHTYTHTHTHIHTYTHTHSLSLSLSLSVTPFELDSQFSMRLLFMMEKAYNIPLLSQIDSRNQEFQQKIQVRQPDAPSAINRWLSSAAGDANKMKPTWRNLSLVLYEIGLAPLAKQMEDLLMEQAIGECGNEMMKGALS